MCWEHKRKSSLPDIFIVRCAIYTTLLCITECIALSFRLCIAKTNKQTKKKERERERDKHMSFTLQVLVMVILFLAPSLSVSFLVINDCPIIGDSHDGQIYV